MPARISGSIFGTDSNTDPKTDADVILTTAAVGYSYLRLFQRKNCAFAAEAEVGLQDSAILNLPSKIGDYGKFEEECAKKFEDYKKQLDAFAKRNYEATKGWILHENAIERINSALKPAQIPQGAEVMVDATPNFGEAGVIWIVGGTGDLSLLNQNRYINSPIMSDKCGILLDQIEKEKIPELYKGRGAYTGFSAREKGQPGIFSTYRSYPLDAFGQRWLPLNPQLSGAKEGIGPEPNQIAVWGMIGSNAAATAMKEQGMVFRDLSEKSPPYESIVVGYTHGMIQAIYDVAKVKRQGNGDDPGQPFEIGLKSSTTKMASCFLCGLFMEATLYPASSIHLGATDSWAPSYPEAEQDALNASIGGYNDAWSSYCTEVLKAGMTCMSNKELSAKAYNESFAAMQRYLGFQSNKNLSANLILDAATVHDKMAVRIVRTLPPP